MEEDQNVVHTKELNWYEEDENRLDYDVAFKEKRYKKPAAEKEAEVAEEPRVDVKRLIKNRNDKWEQRLAKARKEAFAEGREYGYDEGFNEAEQQIGNKIHRLVNRAEEAHQDWSHQYQLLNPGLVDLAFDMVEKILGLPVENPKMREQLEEKLSGLLHETDDEIKPQLWVSEYDYGFLEKLVDKYAPELLLTIRISENCNPGEFELETQDETVVHWFREKLAQVVEEIEEVIEEQMEDICPVDEGTNNSEPDAVEQIPDEAEVAVERDSLDKAEADTSDNVPRNAPDKTEESEAQMEEDEITQDVNTEEKDIKSEEPAPQAVDEPKDDTKPKEFLFEDIIHCSDPDVQTIIDEVEETDLAMGLKGTDWQVKQKFLDNMSGEAGAMLQEEMDGLGPVPLNDVKEAQSRTIQKIKQLDDEGQITIH